jgi:hypothetical protein
MLEIERRFLNFKRNDIWFSDRPFDVEGYDSVVFYACKDKVDMPGFTRKDFVTPVIDLTQDEEKIWKNIDRWACRKKINKAYNNGIVVKINERYEEFHRMDVEFRKTKGLPDSHIDIDYIKKYGTLFIAMLDGDIICGEVFLEDKGHIRGLIACSRHFTDDPHKNNLVGHGNRLIIWESIKYAKAKGITEYDMGGYYVGSDKVQELEGVNSFKMGFGPKLVTKYNYERRYSRTFDIARRIYDLSAARIYSRSC